ncbi:tRNA adenosine(34) deaminase TadA [Clostridium sp. D2Q-11]|uniref:tRNA-specific adenosine deaminase n=1 Tax=Anaeromonas frigoriresistens TaxID=2683708 RepID=A0A942V0X5_9FIRM|nr:tRNA adenosine(34) deaminase TadA [Anaeromonas frigoriresistens]MBS4539157.1 tRNA adenosine(34) deaminase TadA [Anaeromonas frigoriresistens]
MDRYFMKRALREAQNAYNLAEVPIGCIIVKDNKIIASAHNLREELKDPTAHAEIMAIQDAADFLGGWRLSGCTMYVTIEPCPMCAGAIVNSRIEKLVIGAPDLKGGGCGSIVNIVENNRLNHQVDVTWGILEEECSTIMKDFFKNLRKSK